MQFLKKRSVGKLSVCKSPDLKVAEKGCSAAGEDLAELCYGQAHIMYLGMRKGSFHVEELPQI